MPLLDMACPNCIRTLHSDEVWFDNPRTGKRQCTGCGHHIGEYSGDELKTVYQEKSGEDDE